MKTVNNPLHKVFLWILVLIGLILGSKIAYSQTYPVPVVLFDSLVFEVQRGRICDSLSRAQSDEIMKLGNELIKQGELLRLTQLESDGKSFIIGRWEAEYQALNDGIVLMKKTFKAKINRLLRVVFIEGVGIVVLVVLLL